MPWSSFSAPCEEISWGQRIFGWQTTGYFLENNRQYETNLHNLAFGEEQLAKTLFGSVLTTVLLLYLVVLPPLYPRVRWIAKLADALMVPVPGVRHTIIAVAASLLVAVVDLPASGKSTNSSSACLACRSLSDRQIPPASTPPAHPKNNQGRPGVGYQMISSSSNIGAVLRCRPISGITSSALAGSAMWNNAFSLVDYGHVGAADDDARLIANNLGLEFPERIGNRAQNGVRLDHFANACIAAKQPARRGAIPC